MLAPLTKRTEQSSLFECDEERSATTRTTVSMNILIKFECDEERSATGYLFVIIPAHLPCLNAMKSGVQLVTLPY